MIRVAVVGATGYAGAELVRILKKHPEVKLSILSSRQYAGQNFSDVFPAFMGSIDERLELYDPDKIKKEADLVFLALPHKVSMSMAAELLDSDCRLIDLSADFRFSDAALYEKTYEKHTAADLCSEAVYGLSEIFHDKIRSARLIGNPGCYPTCILLALLPLFAGGFLKKGFPLICDAKSGVSGAGRGLSLGTHYCEVAQGCKAYKVGTHRHRPEITAVLEAVSGEKANLTFTPHLLPSVRGMLASSYLTLSEGTGEKEIRDCFLEAYKDQPFVRILPEGIFPDIANVRGTNYCDIAFSIDPETGLLILISAIDNLIKGAAGQAVQNMNIMYGLRQESGLGDLPFIV